MPSYPGFYDEWAKKKTFAVGDVLQISSRGNSSSTLEKPGDYFYFSSVGKHCEFGQKLHVIVSEGSSKSSHQLHQFLQVLIVGTNADTTKSSGQETNDDEGGGWMLQSTRKGM
ncbi:hypothetical protein JHK82_020227 [Glycine max]|nr:hypothetical protein JHK82_020227 [Glycine max]